MNIKHVLGVVALGLAAVACGNNECEDAADKAEECGISSGQSDDEVSECSEKNECAAKCINDASCADLKAAFGDKPDLNSPVFACAAKC